VCLLEIKDGILVQIVPYRMLVYLQYFVNIYSSFRLSPE